MTGQGIWAVLPIKELSGAKQRLSPVFSAEFRRQLAVAMVTDVLSALGQTRGLSGLMVVTVDPEAIALAKTFGARILADGAVSGQTAAIDSAVRTLMAEGASGLLQIPGDVPGVTAEELEQVLDAHRPAPSFTIVPAHDRRGSNTVICSPPDSVPLRFGNDSFLPHLDSARRLGIEPTIIPMERVGLDIDNPEDLFAFSAKGWPTRTTAFLERSGFRTPKA